MFNLSPVVSEVQLSREYRFMYENFVIATQHETFLLLERNGDQVHALKFDSPNIKYGAPNDEARGGHPLSKYGLGFYGLFEVKNSPWEALINSWQRTRLTKKNVPLRCKSSPCPGMSAVLRLAGRIFSDRLHPPE